MRRTATVTITREGRDKGGVFELQEMPAFQAAEWLMRAGQLLARAGTDIPGNIADSGITGFVAMGVGAIVAGIGKAPWHEVKPLLDELLTCVKSYQPVGGQVPLTSWGAIASQIMEPATVMQLHEEVLSLMVGFSVAAACSTYVGKLAAIVTNAIGQSAQTSAEKSASSLPADMPA